jgi:hypothetical protein
MLLVSYNAQWQATSMFEATASDDRRAQSAAAQPGPRLATTAELLTTSREILTRTSGRSLVSPDLDLSRQGRSPPDPFL